MLRQRLFKVHSVICFRTRNAFTAEQDCNNFIVVDLAYDISYRTHLQLHPIKDILEKGNKRNWPGV